MYRAVSLFSGIGGIDLAFALAGFDITAQVEIDPYCREVLRKHAGQYWPNAAQFTDVRSVGADELGTADVIFGGFPCQDISIAGNGAGLAGERSGLWYEFRRIIGEVRPRFVFLENVPAITFRGGAEVVGHLAALGYDARWGIVAASDAGAPHQRSRWWCVGYRDGFGYDLSTDAGINGSALRQASPRTHDAAEPERTRPVWQQLAGDASGLGLQTRADFAASVREEPFADVAGTADGGDVEDASGVRYGIPNDAAQDGTNGQQAVSRDIERESQQSRAERTRPIPRPADGSLSQPRMGRDAHGLPGGLDGHRFPAGPGPQHPWEPPRQIVSRGPHWKHRVKALGNAVVPQVVYPFAVEIMRLLEAD